MLEAQENSLRQEQEWKREEGTGQEEEILLRIHRRERYARILLWYEREEDGDPRIRYL